MRPCRTSLLAALTAALVLPPLFPADLAAQPRGYQPRPCGFDMNDNGVVGESADCRVCDGVTADPDGDGVDEDLVYIDADTGSDATGDGSPGNPYATIQFAWNSSDGPGDGAEDILCFAGTATTEEEIHPPHGGVPGTFVVPKSGSQGRDWQMPRNPTMLVGWDRDGDGAYPPFDGDDTAVLSGTGGGPGAGLATTFLLGPENDYLEIAHLTLTDYGRYTPDTDSGLVRHTTFGDGLDYVSYHDLATYNINRDRQEGRFFTINIFHSGLHWIHFENLLFQDNGGYFARGSAEDSGPDMGPIRWQSITRVIHNCDHSTCSSAGVPSFKIWGYISGIEILDSIWDTNVDGWEPNPNGGHGHRWAIPAQCSQDWLIRNNEIIDTTTVLDVQDSSVGFCDGADARPVSDIVFDRNIATNTYPEWGFGNVGIKITAGDLENGEGDDPGETIGNVTITNNFLSTQNVGWDSCIWVWSGNWAAPPPGRMVIANNTCVGRVRTSGAIAIGNQVEPLQTFPQQDFLIENNIVRDVGSRNFATTYAPTALISDANVFDPGGEFVWNGGPEVGLAAWKASSGVDALSRSCIPAFRDEAAADFHLLLTDTCARGTALDLAAITEVDIDAEPRPAGAWDAGADQFSAEVFADGFESGNSSAWSRAVP